jgi:hypothetical protein
LFFEGDSSAIAEKNKEVMAQKTSRKVWFI